MATEVDIHSSLHEQRVFAPSDEFQARAYIRSLEEYERLYREAAQDPETFWAGIAHELHWFKPWDRVLEWNLPFAKWFVGGKLNLSYNCLDRHVTTWRKNKAAIVWEGEPGDSRTLTYQQLHREVCLFANALKSLGVGKGDRVTIYMPMIPEAAVAMLACARIGATHSVVFGGFSADAVADRNNDAKSKVVITADGGWRRGKVVPLKTNVDQALEKSPSVEKCVVLNRCNTAVPLTPGRDAWWPEVVADASADSPAEP